MKRRGGTGILLLICLVAGALTAVSPGVALAKPWLHVEGNQIKDPAGDPVCLRGVSVIPDEDNNGPNHRPLREIVKLQQDSTQGWYARVVRVPVTFRGGAWDRPDPPIKSQFAAHVQPFVDQAVSLDEYVIIDLHLIEDYGAAGVKQQFLMDWWTHVAPHYANQPNVIFELFNEPVEPNDWNTWKTFIQPVVNAVRAIAPKNLIMVGGPDWSHNVNGALTNPITGGNIVYVYHFYPHDGEASASNIDARFGNAARMIPVIVGEFGWDDTAAYSDDITHGTTSGWGSPLRQYLDARPWISWVSWIFSNYWHPEYFGPNWKLLGGEDQGQFMKQWLYEMRDNHQPGGESHTSRRPAPPPPPPPAASRQP
jgi:hypothetical protein